MVIEFPKLDPDPGGLITPTETPLPSRGSPLMRGERIVPHQKKVVIARRVCRVEKLCLECLSCPSMFEINNRNVITCPCVSSQNCLIFVPANFLPIEYIIYMLSDECSMSNRGVLLCIKIVFSYFLYTNGDALRLLSILCILCRLASVSMRRRSLNKC